MALARGNFDAGFLSRFHPEVDATGPAYTFPKSCISLTFHLGRREEGGEGKSVLPYPS